MLADRRLWLNTDRTKVVEDGAATAAFLMASPGDEIPEQYQSQVKSKPTPKPAGKATSKPVADKK